MQESYQQDSIDVFISHAGPDKLNIARPLFEKLEADGKKFFLDKKSMQPGDCGPDEMTKAMKSAKVGVFILSPEFAARKWTMRELRCFLGRREEAIRSGRQPPTLIPVFYRLSIRECRKLEPSEHQDNEGNNIFEVEKFFSEERQCEASTEMVKRELQELADITGIENDEKATNRLEDEFSHLARKQLVERVFLAVKKKCEEHSSDVVTEGVHGPFEEEAKRSDAIGDARHQMRTTSAEDPKVDGFKASFQVPKNPDHVILKFGRSEDAGNSTERMTAPEERLRRSVLRPGDRQNVGAVGARRGGVVGTKGMGGIGKSCALRGLASDEEVRSRFCDGIYWLVLGQDATERGVMEQLARITRESGGETQAKEVREESVLESAVSRVTEWFKGKTILLLIDDVWREGMVGREGIAGSKVMSRLREIADVENSSRTAFTAREWGVVEGSEEIQFSTKEDASSLEILLKSADIQREEVEGLGDQTDRILRFCGGLPLALSVVGRAIARHREIAKELCLKNVLDEYLECLEATSSILLDERADGTYLYENLSMAFEVSLCMMDRKKTRGDGQLMSYAEMYESLVVIRRQGWLPLSVLCLLWRRKGKAQALKVLHEFVEASLVERKDGVSSGRKIAGVRLHDLQLDYVQQRCGNGGEKRWHEKLVQEWQWNESENRQEAPPWVCGRGWKKDMVEDEYFRHNLCRHLKGAQLGEDLWDVLSDARWVAEKLTRAEGLNLQEDFKILTDVAGEDGERCEAGGRLWSLQKIARQARLSASFVRRSSREVLFQLYDGLLRFRNESEVIGEFLRRIEEVAEKPWLKSLTPGLNVSGAVQHIFPDQGRVVGMSGCAAKNEVIAWGGMMKHLFADKNEVIAWGGKEHLFRRTFRDGEMEENVLFEVAWGVRRFWSENGKYVAVVQADRTSVQVWDMHTGATAERVGQELDVGHLERFYSRPFDLTGDGKRVAFGREDGVVVLWDVERGVKIKEAANMGGHVVQQVSLSPGGKRLACTGKCGSNGSILILCAETGEMVRVIGVPSIRLADWTNGSISWSNNGKRVACVFQMGLSEARLWIFDGETGRSIAESAPLEYVRCLSWSEDGTLLYCGEHRGKKGGGKQGVVSVRDGRSGKRISSLLDDFLATAISLSGDGRWLAASSSHGVSVRDTETGAEVRRHMATHGSHVVVLGWLEDGKRMFSADENFNIVIWRWDNLERVQEEEEEVDKVNKEGQEFTAVAWSSDDICATVVGDGDVVMYDVKTGKKMWGDAETHVSHVYCLEMSRDSKRVFTAAEDGTFAMWDSKTGDKLWEDWAKGGYAQACWSNDGTRVFVSFGRGMGLWDGKTGNKLWERITDAYMDIGCMAWAGNDTKIALGGMGNEGRVVLLSARTGEAIRVACGHTDGRVVLRGAKTGETMGDAPERVPDSVGLKWAADQGLLEWYSDEFADEVHIDWFNFVKRPWREGEEGVRASFSVERAPFSVGRALFPHAVKWSPDDKWIASTGYNMVENDENGKPSRGGVMIWNWETDVTYRYQLKRYYKYGLPRYPLEWSDDGRRVALGIGEELAIWDIETGVMLRCTNSEEYRMEIAQIAWFRDGSRMATLGGGTLDRRGGTLRILSVTSQSAVCEKQYDDVGYLKESDLRQFIDTNEGKLTAADLERKLERKLRIRQKGDGVFYKTAA
ncbi:WD40-repeat containing protein [Chondrus crispus]|uniref:WD40-repeat containing protein n=1 Tax=Chondrus crispus TaxID=2769 RepID=R7QJD7_CHOCR|nr:WD40-repeat containing protein [Chondrus crispus]CDF37505.1 WD40-repeat containing protein [Chondrus crispus]|eukprot:XP_005717376.1 WD40-repeat containing protein [Chondrus crispus]